MKNKVTVEISQRTIIFAALFAVGLGVLWQIKGIVLGLFISFLIMTALNPLVTALQKARVPRAASSMVLLLLILAGVISGVAVLVPPVAGQVGNLFYQLPSLLRQLGIDTFDWSLFSSQIGSVPANALKVISGAFGNILAVFAVLVVSFYLLLEHEQLAKRFRIFFGDDEETAENLMRNIENKLGGWVRGQIFLCLIVGVMVYAGLLGLGIAYALPLSIISGILEIVPNIGPVISMVPAIIVGFTISPLHGAGVLALYFVVQQLENNFIVPQVMRRAVGLDPLATLVSLMVGYRLGGALMAILAIPLVVTIQAIFPFVYGKYNKRGKKGR